MGSAERRSPFVGLPRQEGRGRPSDMIFPIPGQEGPTVIVERVFLDAVGAGGLDDDSKMSANPKHG